MYVRGRIYIINVSICVSVSVSVCVSVWVYYKYLKRLRVTLSCRPCRVHAKSAGINCSCRFAIHSWPLVHTFLYYASEDNVLYIYKNTSPSPPPRFALSPIYYIYTLSCACNFLLGTVCAAVCFSVYTWALYQSFAAKVLYLIAAARYIAATTVSVVIAVISRLKCAITIIIIIIINCYNMIILYRYDFANCVEPKIS